MGCEEKIHPLQREGTNQQQRLLDGLKAGYVNIDEKDFADWIVFARAFAEYLKYFSKTNTLAGNWKGFFDNDISAVLGTVAIQNVQAYQQLVKEKFDILKGDDHAGDEALLKKTFGWLFGALLTMSKGMDDYLIKLPFNMALKNDLQNTIKLKLQTVLQKLLSYYKASVAEGLVTELADTENKIFGISFLKAETLVTTGLSPLWVKGNVNWTDYYNSIAADASIYGDPAWTRSRKINHAANHNLFTGLFDQYLKTYSKVVKDSEAALLQTLTNYDSHTPHYTLFLSFLHVYKNAQTHINSITHRHLDFYYKEVLQLQPKSAEANQVHLVFELAKHVNEYLLKKGTQFKAGKDSAGKELIYELPNDVLLNKAKVASLMAVYKGIVTDNYTTEGGVLINNNNRIFASPVVNSADGLGKDLTSENKEWHPFINKTFNEGKLVSIDMPKAQLGFAIASHYLFLSEGQRIVNIKFTTAAGSPAIPSSLDVDCYLTTEKKWYQVSGSTITNGTTNDSAPASVKMLTFTLPGDAPAIVNYNKKVHEGNFNVNVPILKVYLRNVDGSAYSYNALQNISLSKIEVEVKVGLNQSDGRGTDDAGIKNLQLFNDTGLIDASKPFFPFGLNPKKGASLIVGSEEVFKKKNTKIRFFAEWTELPALSDIDFELPTGAEGDYYPKVSMKYLAKGIWKSLISAFDIFNSTNASVDFPTSLQTISTGGNEVILPYEESYPIYSNKSNRGFIKLSLNNSFNYDEYQAAVNKFNVDKIFNSGSAVDPGPPPYVPKLNKISLHYKAYSINALQSASNFANREVQFFHLHPFGEAEQHGALNGNASQTLVPQFSHTPVASNIHTSEFYIGLENLEGGQSVQILFQILEGTTNPLLDKPDEHVTWSYLGNNLWKVFEKGDVIDNTLQLIQSGIISFVLPADATIDNTLLPPGFVWLRASVNVHAEAVCKFLEVVAQSAQVTFINNDNAADFLDAALPAGAISKLKVPDSSIKKIKQPYNSFGGRKKETDQQYYTRVSERLRHKSRAITIWDYEHLVLQEFPLIHKVKCVSHTRYVGNEYNPSAPGHVTIVTVPDLQNRNDANPLRPYTNQDVLVEIDAFIKKKISCHVNLHVRHPLFEEVRLYFKVKFFDGFEFKFYEKQLQNEITEFLTPWAFQRSDDVKFGGKIHKSVLINFIEERNYVDFITDVKMYLRKNESSPESGDLDTIEATTAISILVSAQASKHTIGEITEAEAMVANEPCIDNFNDQTA